MKAEISYDLVMDEDMPFVEGSYRLPECDWQVLIFVKKEISEPEVRKNCRWDSGVRGTSVLYPSSRILDKYHVEKILAEVLGVTEWLEVRGPDSMQLR